MSSRKSIYDRPNSRPPTKEELRLLAQTSGSLSFVGPRGPTMPRESDKSDEPSKQPDSDPNRHTKDTGE